MAQTDLKLVILVSQVNKVTCVVVSIFNIHLPFQVSQMESYANNRLQLTNKSYHRMGDFREPELIVIYLLLRNEDSFLACLSIMASEQFQHGSSLLDKTASAAVFPPVKISTDTAAKTEPSTFSDTHYIQVISQFEVSHDGSGRGPQTVSGAAFTPEPS